MHSVCTLLNHHPCRAHPHIWNTFRNSARILRSPYNNNYFSNMYKKLSEPRNFVISQPMLGVPALALEWHSKSSVCKWQYNMNQHWKLNHLMCKIKEYFTFFAYSQVPSSLTVLQHRAVTTRLIIVFHTKNLSWRSVSY